MADRKYTLAEIDAMRKIIGKKHQAFYEYSCQIGGTSRQTEASLASCRAASAATEDELRTALVAGLGPEDFIIPA